MDARGTRGDTALPVSADDQYYTVSVSCGRYDVGMRVCVCFK